MIALLGVMVAVLALIAFIVSVFILVVSLFGYKSIKSGAIKGAKKVAKGIALEAEKEAKEIARDVALNVATRIALKELQDFRDQMQASELSQSQTEELAEPPVAVKPKRPRTKATNDEGLRKEGSS